MFYERSLRWDKVFFFLFPSIWLFLKTPQHRPFCLRPTVLRLCQRNSQCLWLVLPPGLHPVCHPTVDGGVGGLLRLPAGWPGSALPTGCSWRSTRASRRSPSLAVRGCPRTPRTPPSPRTPPAPRTPAPPQLRGRKRKRDVKNKIKKEDKRGFWIGWRCNLWCVDCLPATWERLMERLKHEGREWRVRL